MSAQDQERAYCAWCIRFLPRPATWTKRSGKDGPETVEVEDWTGAVLAREQGFRYEDVAYVDYDLYAVTVVEGTSACYSHAYFAMGSVIG